MRQQQRFEYPRQPINIDCFGKVIVRNIDMRFITDDSLRVWLSKYGKIEETKILETGAIVKFSSDAEAAVAVQRENGSRRFGNPASVDHAEPHLIWSLERSTQDPHRSYRLPSDGDTQGGLKRPIVSTKSPPSPLRNVKSAKKAEGSSNDFGPLAMKILRPYEVAILAITHDLVPYAEAVKSRLSALADPSIADYYSPRSHIMVLTEVAHLPQCIQDLTVDGVLFAIIVDAANWTRYSCTLRILHSAEQQEHRNIPLVEAISFLSNDYSTHLTPKVNAPPEPIVPPVLPQVAPSAPVLPPPASEEVPESSVRNRSREDDFVEYSEAEEDDPAFVKPSRRIATLLRMLADSRILSVGELDQLIAFITDRRNRLNQQYTSLTPSGGNANWKSQVMDMLTPPSASFAAPQNPPTPTPPSQVFNRNPAPPVPEQTQEYRNPPVSFSELMPQQETTHSGFDNGLQESESTAVFPRRDGRDGSNQLSSSSKPAEPSSAAKVYYQNPQSRKDDRPRQPPAAENLNGRDSASRIRRRSRESSRSRREPRFDDRRSPSPRSARRSGDSYKYHRRGVEDSGYTNSPTPPTSARFVIPPAVASTGGSGDARAPPSRGPTDVESPQQPKKDWARLYGKDFEDY